MKKTRSQKRRNNPHERSLIIQQCQLPHFLNVEKTTSDEWIKEGKSRYFRAKSGGTKFFIVEHIAQDIDNMYNTYHSDDTYEIGDK